jgi:hypothetical protein
MRVSPAGLRVPLSYLPGIGSGETNGVVVTSSEAEICLKRETLVGGASVHVGTISTVGLELGGVSAAFLEVIWVLLIITPDRKVQKDASASRKNIKNISLDESVSVRFGLKPDVWTAAAAIYKDKNIVETIEADTN